MSLRCLIDNAKKDQVPAHIIEKAFKKAEGGAGEDFVPDDMKVLAQVAIM